MLSAQKTAGTVEPENRKALLGVLEEAIGSTPKENAESGACECGSTRAALVLWAQRTSEVENLQRRIRAVK